MWNSFRRAREDRAGKRRGRRPPSRHATDVHAGCIRRRPVDRGQQRGGGRSVDESYRPAPALGRYLIVGFQENGSIVDGFVELSTADASTIDLTLEAARVLEDATANLSVGTTVGGQIGGFQSKRFTVKVGRQVANGDFECGPDLAGWTTSGINGGYVVAPQEGTCFSAYNTLGLTLDGSFAANVRSGVVQPVFASVGILTSDPFVAGNSIAFEALSENGDNLPDPNPVTFEARILDVSGSTVLHSQGVVTNVVTLAFDPTCTGGDVRDQTFSSHVIDTSPFAGQTVRLEFRQHSNDAIHGWFTLIDNVTVPDGGPSSFRCAPGL